MMTAIRDASCLPILLMVLLGGAASPLLVRPAAAQEAAGEPPAPHLVTRFGARGDGRSDDTEAIQRAVDAGLGEVRFPRGTYRIRRPIEVALDQVGFTSLCGDGSATIVMAGPGPAIRVIGTHEGTASPATVKENVWQRQRAPLIDKLEIVGAHGEADGLEATGTMQIMLSRLVIRKVRHAVHLVGRNRNVIISECHLYENTGVGVFYDHVNLHQSNITNCHISYNDRGGIVLRGGDVRNVQVGSCDIEGNMAVGGPPTANVLLDATGGSLGEIAIVGCTIQHDHAAPDSANIRVDFHSQEVNFTDERRHGNLTIADNVLSDVQVNVEVRNARGTTITGNTIWKGYRHNVLVENCQSLVFSNNVLDRNPRYHYGDGPDARLGVVFRDCRGCTLVGNHLHGVGGVDAALVLERCREMNIDACTLVDVPVTGILLRGVTGSRVSDCLIRSRVARGGERPVAIRSEQCRALLVRDNLLLGGVFETEGGLPDSFIQNHAVPDAEAEERSDSSSLEP